MNEWDKAQAGYLYDANYDKKIVESRTKCADLCYEFNQCRPSDTENLAFSDIQYILLLAFLLYVNMW